MTEAKLIWSLMTYQTKRGTRYRVQLPEVTGADGTTQSLPDMEKRS